MPVPINFTLTGDAEISDLPGFSLFSDAEVADLVQPGFVLLSDAHIREPSQFSLKSDAHIAGIESPNFPCDQKRDRMYFPKEGAPFNSVVVGSPPASIWNATEDPNLPMDEDSLSALVCSRNLLTECKQCVSAYEFAMASTHDLTIKKFTDEIEERAVYSDPLDVTFYPENVPFFPNTSVGSYDTVGYPTLLQTDATQYGIKETKLFTAIKVEMDFKPQLVPGLLFAQAGVSNSPKCLDWYNDKPATIDCNRGRASDVVEDGLRPARPTGFNYFRAGSWIGCRLFVATDANDPNYAPKGCGVSINQVNLKLKQKNETWTNQ